MWQRLPRALRWLALPFIVFVLIWLFNSRTKRSSKPTPFLDQYIASPVDRVGRWYIPPSWLESSSASQPTLDASSQPEFEEPRTSIEAANLALRLAVERKKFIAKSTIPLVVHQTWKDYKSDTWPQDLREGVEAWLAMSVEGQAARSSLLDTEMAYILWDDDAVRQFFAVYEPTLRITVDRLPHPVEVADVFRVAVLKWFGGIYADMDTLPLERPYFWVHDGDVKAWLDPKTSQSFTPHVPAHSSYTADEESRNYEQDSNTKFTHRTYEQFLATHTPSGVEIGAICGIEADTRPESDWHWRAGYTYPIQLSNWAFALAPHHPIAAAFLKQAEQAITDKAATLYYEDPLNLTGPPAFTEAVKAYTEGAEPHFRWESVSALNDPAGGRGKVVAGDVLVLPITGFSPGRGIYMNMGSQPITHPNARLLHKAAGSWRKKSMKVLVGKGCRLLFGLCKDWSKFDP